MMIEVIKYDMPCQNQAYPLNNNCICHNDVVLTGKGSCAGKDLIKDKPNKVNYRSTKGITKNNFKRNSRKELQAVYEV